MNAAAHIVPSGHPTPGPYERELARRLDTLLAQHAGELARLGWFARRRRTSELRRWVEAELSCEVRAGKLPPKRGWLSHDSLGGGPVIH